jgi:hypothetical protein
MRPRPTAPIWLALLPALAPACDQKSPAPAPSAAPTAVVTATGTASATTSAAPAASATGSSAPASTSSEQTPPASPEPTLKEWDASKQDLSLVKHWDRPGCTGRRVREWIRVSCSGQLLQKGEPISITIEKGFKPTPLSILSERGGTIWLIFPLTEGLDGSAVYSFAGGSFRFTAKWPKGEPEPKPVGAFEELSAPEPAPDAPADVADPAPAPAEPAKPTKPTLTTDPLPDEPTLEGAPTREQWDSLREVGVRGSDARGCQTKQSGDWFRVVCRANDVTGKLTSATATKGFDEKQGYLVVGNGSMVLVTRYVRGSDLSFDLVWEKQSARLHLEWPDSSSGPPAIRGEIVAK